MTKIIFVYGAENPAARKLIEDFYRDGHRVYAGVTGNNKETIEAIRKNCQDVTAFMINPADISSVKKAADYIREKEGHLDILVLSSEKRCTDDGEIGKIHDYEEIMKVYDFNVNGAFKTIQTFLPLLRLGNTKRIAFLNRAESSINWCLNTVNYAYHMSLASINMMLKIYFNALRPEGFTFRNYCWDEDENGKRLIMPARDYILRDFYNEPHEAFRSEENRLVMRDSFHREIPW